MKCNVGGMDRVARIVVGAALVAYAYYAKQPIAYIGVIPLVTGLVGFCPLYPLFKFSSCKKED
ncbi:MAG: DUF2892 domain-containing protein [Sulfurospirillaceae bacterium]|nr:DUF2892 domain-containing protein [Sulfurospirillaceae bacterium]